MITPPLNLPSTNAMPLLHLLWILWSSKWNCSLPMHVQTRPRKQPHNSFHRIHEDDELELSRIWDGLGSSRCKRLVGTHQPDFLYLCETKISVSAVNKSLSCLGYGNYVGTEPIRKGGETYITWKSDFLKGRLISDNILLAGEILNQIHAAKRGSKHLAALKIDFAKAFDKLSWSFIRATLTRMNFPPKWINLI